MITVFLISAAGRIAVVLMGVDILLPYLLRRTALSRRLGISLQPSDKFLHGMWPHYWCAYLLLVFSLVHAWIAMAAVFQARSDTAGLWFATAAFGLMIIQIAIGLLLKDRRTKARKQFRRFHYWAMMTMVVAVAAHIWLNS